MELNELINKLCSYKYEKYGLNFRKARLSAKKNVPLKLNKEVNRFFNSSRLMRIRPSSLIVSLSVR